MSPRAPAGADARGDARDVWVTFEYLRDSDPDLLCAVMLGWSLPLAAWLARELFAPGLRLPRRRRAAQPAYA